MASDLKKKTLSGMIWSFVQRFGTMAISFVSNIVLARLLTPDDYGTIGMLMIFIAVANTFVDGGFGSALIQKKEPTQEDYSTIFWWNMFLSIVLYGLLYLGAPAVARFYNLPLLCDVLRVQGIVLIINALSIIQQNQLRKQLKFKRLATVTVISAILSAGTAIILAYIGWGVWALVAQQLMLSGFTAIQLWVLNKWYPLLIFSKESFKQLFGFGGFILASNLINTFCNNLQGLIIGKFFPPATLGYYTQAHKLENVASQSVTSVVEQVSYPVFVQFQSDNNALKRVYFKLLESVVYVTNPLILILILVAEPLIQSLYGDQWLPCVPYFKILCIVGLSVCAQHLTYYVIASKGHSKILFRWNIYKRIVSLTLILGGMALWGIYGLLYGFAISAWLSVFANVYLVYKSIDYKMSHQLRDILPVYIISVLTYFIVNLISTKLNTNIYWEAAVCVCLFAIIYISFSLLFKIEVFNTLWNVIKTRSFKA